MKPMPNPTTAEQLLSHAEWVRALAGRLVTDPTLREDLEQQTWVASLETSADVENPRGWLSRVLRNKLWESRRATTRRSRLAAAAPIPDEPASPPDVVARAELQRRIADAVLALDEPYRSTILLTYFEGESTERIASLHGVRPATVRSRLKRGLDLLRARFRPDQEEHRAAWCGLLLAGRTETAAVAGSGATGATMLTRLVFFAAVAAGVTVPTFLLRTDADSTPPARVAAAPVAARPAAPAPIQVAVPVRGATTTKIERSDAAPPLEGTVVDDAGRPVEGAHLFVVELVAGPATYGAPLFRAETDAEGRFRLPADAVGAGNRTVVAERDGFAPQQMPLRAGTKVKVPLFPAATLTGRVLDGATGRALPGVTIDFPNLTWTAGVKRPIRTDAAGRYRFDKMPTYGAFAVVVPDGALPVMAPLSVSAAGEQVHDFVVDAGKTLRGTAVDEHGAPVAGAVVSFDWYDLTTSDARGAFEVRGFTSDCTPIEVTAPGRAATVIEIATSALDAGAPTTFPLFRECVVTGTVSARPNAPSAGAVVTCGFGAPELGDPSPVPAGVELGTRRMLQVVTDARGRFELHSLPPHRALELHVMTPTGDWTEVSEPAFGRPGETRTVDVVLEEEIAVAERTMQLNSRHGTVMTEDGEVVAGTVVRCSAVRVIGGEAEAAPTTEATTQPDGSFRIDLPAEDGFRLVLSIDVPGASPFVLDSPRDDRPIELVVPVLAPLTIELTVDGGAHLSSSWRRSGESSWRPWDGPVTYDAANHLRSSTLELPVGTIDLRVTTSHDGEKKEHIFSDVEVTRAPRAPFTATLR